MLIQSVSHISEWIVPRFFQVQKQFYGKIHDLTITVSAAYQPASGCHVSKFSRTRAVASCPQRDIMQHLREVIIGAFFCECQSHFLTLDVVIQNAKINAREQKNKKFCLVHITDSQLNDKNNNGT